MTEPETALNANGNEISPSLALQLFTAVGGQIIEEFVTRRQASEERV